MRVVSQDGMSDVPYENSCLDIVCLEPKRTAIYFKNIHFDVSIRLAGYSTKEKAIKAMEMLREQYSRIRIIKALASGTCEHMEKSLKPEEFKDILEEYINMEVFQFPQDDEIEV